jgi:hypothetical protein
MSKIKFLIATLLITIGLVLGGCSSVAIMQEQPSTTNNTSMFVRIEAFKTPYLDNCYVVYAKDTKVMYIISPEGIATVMLNPDGTPQIYSK